MGLSTIARELFPDLTGRRQSTGIERVKASISAAVKLGYLRCAPLPPEEALVRKFKEHHFFKNSEFHFVDDSHSSDGVDSFYDLTVAAADVIAERVTELIVEKPPGSKIYIANAGGPTLSECIRHLACRVEKPERGRDIVSISLNNAGIPERYGYSANVIAVQIADIYGGTHIAVPTVLPDESDVKAHYQTALENLDLLLCGAGTREGLLFNWLRAHQKFVVPDEAVGDMCLIPLDKQGNPVSLPEGNQKYLHDHLRPKPSFDKLINLVARDPKIVMCVFGNPPPPNISALHRDALCASKLPIAIAVLKKPIAKNAIMPVSLAKAIIDHKSQ